MVNPKTKIKEKNEGLMDRLIHVNRVTKVVKGGKNFSLAAIVIVGDGKGRIGYGTGKAKEVPDAVRKATEQAKRNMIRVPLKEGRTIHHDVIARFGSGKVILRSAQSGTGIIAGGPMRAIFEVLGIQDIVSKSQVYRAAAHFNPDVDFIIDIGGQDMKCFKIRNGAVD